MVMLPAADPLNVVPPAVPKVKLPSLKTLKILYAPLRMMSNERVDPLVSPARISTCGSPAATPSIVSVAPLAGAGMTTFGAKLKTTAPVVGVATISFVVPVTDVTPLAEMVTTPFGLTPLTTAPENCIDVTPFTVCVPSVITRAGRPVKTNRCVRARNISSDRDAAGPDRVAYVGALQHVVYEVPEPGSVPRRRDR